MRAHKIRMAVVALLTSLSANSAELSYLQGLLDATPAGGWVKANSNRFSDAWPTGLDLPPPTPSGPAAVVYAWSSFAWDSTRGNLLIYGGGHANYVGNEVYVWQGSNGSWTRGTLPSRVDLASHLVVGNGAPQSAHTYQTNSYVPINDRFVAFGGGGWNSGGNLSDANGRTGPWWWNPAKADPEKVGGADGTGWDPSRQGSSSWQARPYDPWVGLPRMEGRGYAYGTTAYRTEEGKDVIYLTMDQNASGFPALMRYELGDEGTPDRWQQVGVTENSYLQSGAAMIDSRRGMFVRTSLPNGPNYQSDLAIWNLANNNASSPQSNRDMRVQLVDVAGMNVDLSFAASIDYDLVNDQYIIWDGRNQGTVWITKPVETSPGVLSPVWTVHAVSSTTSSQPIGNHGTGVLGKWKYVSALGAFVAMDEYRTSLADAEIWLYKPIGVVPEPGSASVLLMGLGVVAWVASRRLARFPGLANAAAEPVRSV